MQARAFLIKLEPSLYTMLCGFSQQSDQSYQNPEETEECIVNPLAPFGIEIRTDVPSGGFSALQTPESMKPQICIYKP